MAQLSLHCVQGLTSWFRGHRQRKPRCTPDVAREPPSPTPTPPPPPIPPSPPVLPPASASSPFLSPSPSPPLPLLELPADIVLYLCRDHLSPAAAAALSLTCKALFALVFPAVRPTVGVLGDRSEREDLQLLLEKDLGQHWWHCQGCSLLHRISSRGPRVDLVVLPTSDGRLFRCPNAVYDAQRPHHNSRRLSGTTFVLEYQTVRLVMNRHFLGPPNGLPLESFDVEASSTESNLYRGRLLPWREKWTARIIQDELLLKATRTLSGAGWDDESLRGALDQEYRDVCGHVKTSCAGVPPACSVNALHRPSLISCFAPCRDLVESCQRCLTDYVTTIERRRENSAGQASEYWFITLTSYYQLGSGRSPTDRKWLIFGVPTEVASYIAQRDMVAHPLGSVKAAWDSRGP